MLRSSSVRSRVQKFKVQSDQAFNPFKSFKPSKIN